ncbi:PREDICTED: uncharacterized protein LOC108564565 [Nicrophorus vespilloides]|uniref:Uncharacterized protein LOC108564565 n=1 Tax=Nicrophorus vespilloides TaxID=110193 RepID=A0ABM1MX36_NICVS|nr:PREDICTED: uncharacterized protein LOC108564565 [Nicrophorus vespilloides]
MFEMVLLLLCANMCCAAIEPEDSFYNEISASIEAKPTIAWTTIIVCDTTNNSIDSMTDITIKEYSKSPDGPNLIYVFNKNFHLLSKLETTTRMELIVVDKIADIGPFLDESNSSNDQNRFRRVLFLINSDSSDNFDKLKPAFRQIWDYDIWNANILFYYETRIYDYVYNPFLDELISLNTSKTVLNQFDKFSNLHKYEIIISMIDDPPKSPYENDSFQGNYIKILNEIANIINATFVIKKEKSIEESIINVQQGLSEFSFVGQFHGVLKGVKYSEPFKRDDIVILVPKASQIPQYLKLIQIFPMEIWLLILSLLIIFLITMYYVERNDISSIFLFLFGVLLGMVGNEKLNKFKLITKLFAITFILFGMVVACTYSSSMLGATITKTYYSEINDLEHLKQTGMNICIIDNLKHLVPDEFKDRIIIVHRNVIVDKIMNSKADCGLALMRSYADGFQRVSYNTNGNTFYHIIDESFIPGFESFYFHKSSPFIYKINEVLKAIDETGLFLYMEQTVVKRNDYKPYTSLTLYHLNAPISLLLIGYLISVVVFCIELCITAIRNREQ